MRRLFLSFRSDDRASVATETALSLPILAALMFGSLELGTYYWAEHKVVKAVRDGARYAARQPYADYAGCVPSSGLIDRTRNVTRTGQMTSGGTARLGYWTDPATITVSVECDTTGTYAGLFAVNSTIGAPVVTVRASVPFDSMFGSIGIVATTLTLNARGESPVYGQ